MNPPMERPTEDSRALWNRARAVLASGVWSITQGSHRYPHDLFPLLATAGRGCYLETADGQELLDWNMTWGAAVLGHRSPEIEAAIVRQVRESGTTLSLLQPLEIEVAPAQVQCER